MITVDGSNSYSVPLCVRPNPADLLLLPKLTLPTSTPSPELSEFSNSLTDNQIQRFYSSHDFDVQATQNSLQNHIQFRQLFLQNPNTLYKRIRDILDTSAMYIHGRDKKYRPVLILNLSSFDLVQVPLDDYIEALIFICYYMEEHMLVPGYVEQWTVLVNMHGTWFSNVTLMDLYRVFSMLADNFPQRLYKLFIFRPPKVFGKVMQILNKYLSPSTYAKIIPEKHRLPRKLLSEVALPHLERQYGGTAPNVSTFWPPFVPANPWDQDYSTFEFCSSGSSEESADFEDSVTIEIESQISPAESARSHRYSWMSYPIRYSTENPSNVSQMNEICG